MSWLFLICGIVLVVIGLLDVFFAVLNYDGFSFLSSRVYWATWSTVRTITKPLPKSMRHFGLSIGAPLMIPATMLMWIVIEILGFGLIYYSQTDYFSYTSGAKPTFLRMIYLSGVTIGTLGYGDISLRHRSEKRPGRRYLAHQVYPDRTPNAEYGTTRRPGFGP